jgi:alpha-L-fucosidase
VKINGAAIYATRPVAPYRDGKVCFTRGKDGAIYATYLLDEGEVVPGTIALKNMVPAQGATIRLLGSDTELKWQREGAGARIVLPETVGSQAANGYALSLRISAVRSRS